MDWVRRTTKFWHARVYGVQGVQLRFEDNIRNPDVEASPKAGRSMKKEDTPMITVQQHIHNEQHRFPDASGTFSSILSGIVIASKVIQAKVRNAGLSDILGSVDQVNVQGEVQQKLDVYANDALVHYLSVRESIGVLASEENEEPIIVHQGSDGAKYAVVFDPLDGSSNIDLSIGVGTIFSIFRRPKGVTLDDPEDWVLQPGDQQVAAGYVLYGSSTILVYTAGQGVHGFTLEPSVGAFMLSHPNIRIPDTGSYYSINEAYREIMPQPYVDFVDGIRAGSLGRTYSLRFIGSMVADVHRTLLRGGIFMYPSTRDFPEGRLRLLYEANPIAFIVEQAGGQATDGHRRIMEIKPHAIHQRIPLMVGGKEEMDKLHATVAAASSS